jgi:hypothetical protein
MVTSSKDRSRVTNSQQFMSQSHSYTKRPSKYVHSVWLAKVLGLESSCLYSVHVKSTYKLPKRSNFPESSWQEKQNELIRSYAEILRDQGYKLHVQEENAFSLKGKSGVVIGGQPAIIAIRNDDVRVYDCRATSPRNIDIALVKLYMLLLPSMHLHGIDRKPNGGLLYEGHIYTLENAAIDSTFRNSFKQVMKTIASEVPPAPTPHARECRHCDVPVELCAFKNNTEFDVQEEDLF